LQQAKGVAPSTGTRGGGWGGKSFLHGNAGKMATIEAKTGNLSEENAKPHACSKV